MVVDLCYSNSQTASEETSEEPSVESEEVEEEVAEPVEPKIVMMADSGNWSDPSTLEKTYQTVYERPQGLPARFGKTLGFIIFFVLFGVGVLEAVPALFRFILGIPQTK